MMHRDYFFAPVHSAFILIEFHLHMHLTKRFPCNWKTPIGYLVTVSIEFAVAINACQYFGCLTMLAFGAFMFSNAFGKIQKNQLDAINKLANDKKSAANMYKKLSEFIWTHAYRKQLSR